MKTKRAILLGTSIFAVIAGSLSFVAKVRSNQALAQAQKARAEAMYAEQQAQRLKLQNPASPAK